MRAAGVVVASLVLVSAAGARVARAQPGMTSPTPAGTGPSTTPAAPCPCPETPPTSRSQLGFAIGVDGHAGIGNVIESNLSLRGELIVAPHHTLLVRAGMGNMEEMDHEYDMPTYSERFARVGYRLSSTHIYLGVELSRDYYKAHWDWVDDTPPHDGDWFHVTSFTTQIGWKLGPVDLAFDLRAGAVMCMGLSLGVGYRRESSWRAGAVADQPRSQRATRARASARAAAHVGSGGRIIITISARHVRCSPTKISTIAVALVCPLRVSRARRSSIAGS